MLLVSTPSNPDCSEFFQDLLRISKNKKKKLSTKITKAKMTTKNMSVFIFSRRFFDV